MKNNKQKLTIEEFLNLSNDEKRERYVELSDYDKFLWRTRYDIPIFFPVESIDEKSKNRKITPEEKAKNRKKMEEILRYFGELKDGEHIPEENWLD